MADSGYSSLATLLNQLNERARKSNPYLNAAAAIQAPAVVQGRANVASGIASALTNITKGFLGAYGNQQAAEEEAASTAKLANYFQNGDYTGMIADPDTAVRTMGLQLLLDQRATERSNSEDLRKTIELEKAKASVKQEFDLLSDPTNRFRASNGLPPQMAVPALASYAAPDTGAAGNSAMPDLSAAPMTPQASAAPPSSAQNMTPTLDGQIRAYVGAGYPLSMAQSMAEFSAKQQQDAVERAKPERTNNAELRRQGMEMLRIGNTVKNVVDQTGYTGRFNWLASAGADVATTLGNEDQRRKLVAQAQLGSVQQDLMKLNKIAGSGNLNAQEVEMMLSSGPTLNKTPAENKALADLMIARGKIALEAADFKDTWAKTHGGDYGGADAAWAQYLGDFSPLGVDAAGQVTVRDIKQEKADWRQMLGGAPQSPQPPTPPTSTGPAPQATPGMMADAIRTIESNGNASAISPAGAQGAYQFMPQTWQTWQQRGVVPPNATPFDEGAARQAALAQIDENMRVFNGNLPLAVAAYNAGAPAVKQAVKAAGTTDWQTVSRFLSPETAAYVPRFVSALQEAATQQTGGQTAAAGGQTAAAGGQTAAAGGQTAAAGEPAPLEPVPVTTARPKGAFEKYVYDPAGSLLQGFTSGLGDELVAGASSLVPGRNYDKELAIQRRELKQFERANPKTALALELAGAVATPMPGAAWAAKGGTMATRALRAAPVGGLIGALFGYGKGEGQQDRYDRAMLGGSAGAIAGPVLTPAVEGVAAAVTSDPVRRLVQALGQRWTGAERQAGRLGGELLAPELAPAEAAALKLGQGTSATELRQITAALLNANRPVNSVPGQLSLFEAAAEKIPAWTGQADLIANDASAPAAQKLLRNALQSRAEKAPDRLERQLAALGSGTTAEGGQVSIVQAANEIIASEKALRAAATKPLYEAAIAEKPVISSPRLNELMKEKLIKQASSEARGTLGMSEAPTNSSQFVKETLSALRGKIGEAKRAGNDNLARQLTQAEAALSTELYRLNPALEVADKAYSAGSFKLNELKDTAVQALNELSQGKDPYAAAQTVFGAGKLAAPELQALRKTFVGQGYGEQWNEFAKSWIIGSLEKSKDNAGGTPNFTRAISDLVGSESARSRLRAIVGPDLYTQLAKALTLESKYIQGARSVRLADGGSPTAGRQLAKEAQTTVIQNIYDVFRRQWSTAEKMLEKAFTTKPDEAMLNDLARILADPERAKTFLKRAIPYQEKIDAWQSVAAPIRRAARKGGSKSGGQLGGRR